MMSSEECLAKAQGAFARALQAPTPALAAELEATGNEWQ